MAFKIYSPCVNSYDYDGATWFLDMAFDNVLLVRDTLQSDALSERQRVSTALALMMDADYAQDVLVAYQSHEERVAFINALVEDVIGQDTNEKVIELDRAGNPLPGQMADLEDDEDVVAKGGYDVNYDATYIYTSFMMAYGMDLHKQLGKLHWQEFQALLRDLPESTPFGEIIKIRSTNLANIKDQKERDRIRKLQRRYKLPQNTASPDKE